MSSELTNDASDRFELARRLVAAGLLQTFTHQAKNDLAGMTGLAELALGHPGLPEEVKHYIQVVMQNGRSLQEASRLLLEYSRGEDQPAEVTPLGEAVRHACSIADSVFLLRHVDLDERIGSVTPVSAARTHLVTLALLLLSDVVGRAAHGTVIVVEVERGDQIAILSIEAEETNGGEPPPFTLEVASSLAELYGGVVTSEADRATLTLPLAV